MKHGPEYDELLTDIRRGVELHYGGGAADADLDLLLGDQAYARGLSKLAELGDLEATAELADVISLVAESYASGGADSTDAVWAAARRAAAKARR